MRARTRRGPGGEGRAYQVSARIWPAPIAQAPITKSTLNTAEPTIVEKPTSDSAISTPTIDVKSSGAYARRRDDGR